jgi:gliding motility-associated-like protein
LFKKYFLRFFFVIAFILQRGFLAYAQVFPTIISPSGDHKTVQKQLTICTDTLTLVGGYINLGGSIESASWSIRNGAGSLIVLSDEKAFLTVLSGATVELAWTVNDIDYKLFVRTLKPTYPIIETSYDTVVCQNQAKLKANKSVIGKGKWTSLTPSLTFSNDSSEITVVSKLQLGPNTLIWQISSTCATLQDTVVVWNQSVPVPDVMASSNVCVDTVYLKAQPLQGDLRGKWWQKVNGQYTTLLDTVPVLSVTSLSVGLNEFKWEVNRVGTSCSASKVVTVTYSKPNAADILVPSKDTVVCANTINLVTKTTGNLYRNGVLVSPPYTSMTLVKGVNRFVFKVLDPTCGESVDSVLVDNKKIDKPISVTDSCFVGIPSDSLSLRLKNGYSTGETGKWSVVSSPLQNALVNDTITHRAKFQPNGAGQYVFKYKASNGSCVDSANTTYRLLTKALLPKDTCVFKDKGSLVLVKIKPSRLPNKARGEEGEWTLISPSTLPSAFVVREKSDTLLSFESLRGVYSFKYVIKDGCTSCGICPNEDAITITISNRARIFIDSICFKAAQQRVKVNQIATNEVGLWVHPLSIGAAGESDSVFVASNLKIGKDTLVWRVTHPNGCGVTSDMAVITRLTTPNAGLDRCYNVANMNLSDTLVGNLSPGEDGQWIPPNGGGLSTEAIVGADTKIIVKKSIHGIYPLVWSVFDSGCPVVFRDTVRLSFLTKPTLPTDTFFTRPFSGTIAPTLQPVPAPLAIKEKSLWTLPLGVTVTTPNLTVPSYAPGKYLFRYAISDSSKTSPCKFEDSIHVVYATRAFINKTKLDICIKDVGNTITISSISATPIVTAEETGTWSFKSPAPAGSSIQSQIGLETWKALITGLPVGKHKIYWTVVSKHGNAKYVTKDSLTITYLSRPVVAKSALCTDTNAILLPASNFPSLQSFEKAYWVKKNSSASGLLKPGKAPNMLLDTLSQMQSGMQMLGLVIRDTISGCSDTATTNVIKVTKAKALAQLTTCITDTMLDIEATVKPAVGEYGRWGYVRSYSNKQPQFVDLTKAQTKVYGLGMRNTRLKWTIYNSSDSTCWSIDTLNTRIVVGTKPRVTPKDTCLIGVDTIKLRGNAKASYEWSKWTKADGTKLATDSNYTYNSLGLGSNKFVWTIYDSTISYQCMNHADTATVNVVYKSEIAGAESCMVLPINGQLRDTLTASKPINGENLFSYTWIKDYPSVGLLSAMNTILPVYYTQAGVYKNKWEVKFQQCKSVDSVITTVISQARAGLDTCFIGKDTFNLKANHVVGLEEGTWSVVPNTLTNIAQVGNPRSTVALKSKGQFVFTWKVKNGACTDSAKFKLSHISKAQANMPPTSCLVDQDTIFLKGNKVSATQKVFWQKLADGTTISTVSVVNVQVPYGLSKYVYIVRDSANVGCVSRDTVKVARTENVKVDSIYQPCNKIDPSNTTVNLSYVRNIPGLSYQWKAIQSFAKDTVVNKDGNYELHYQQAGKRMYEFRSYVNEMPTCSDTVKKTIRINTGITFALDTCVSSASLVLPTRFLPNFALNEYVKISNTQQIINSPSDVLVGYQKGSNTLSYTVWDSDSSCSQSYGSDKVYKVNYITKAKPSSEPICRFHSDTLTERLLSPQNLEPTERGKWSGDGSIEIDTNSSIASGFKLGANALTWRIESTSDAGCYSDSTVMYHTYTPSGFVDTLFSCGKDTLILANRPVSGEIVSWQFLPDLGNGFSVSSQNDSVRVKGLNNDSTYTLYRTIRTNNSSCVLMDYTKVLNKQLRPFQITPIEQFPSGENAPYTCQQNIILRVPNPDNDIEGATFGWKNPPLAYESVTSISGYLSYQFKQMVSDNTYSFVGEVRNWKCPVIRDTFLIEKRKGLIGFPPSISDTVCNQKDYYFKNSRIKNRLNLQFIPDSVKWVKKASDLGYQIVNGDLPIIDSVKLLGLDIRDNDLFFTPYKNGCETTIQIRIVNNRSLDTVKITIETTDSLGCDRGQFELLANEPFLADPDTNFFNFYWSEDILGKKVVGRKRNYSTIVGAPDYGVSKKYYYVVKNGVCPSRADSISLQNYQSVKDFAAINNKENDTICTTQLSLVAKRPSFGVGSWTVNDSKAFFENPNAFSTILKNLSHKDSSRYIITWTVANGVCVDKDSMYLIVGDSISTAIVKDSVKYICGEDSVTLMSEPFDGNSLWLTPDNDSLSSANITVPTDKQGVFLYQWIVYNDYCINRDTTTLYYYKQPTPAYAGPDQTTTKQTVYLNANTPDPGTGEWVQVSGSSTIVDKRNPQTEITDLGQGANEFVWRISNGVCPVSEDKVVINSSELMIPEGFSPNGDGKNDRFEIRGLETYADTKLKVFNRWGQEVYSSSSYKNEWDADGVDDDTYYWVMNIPTLKEKRGYVVVKRK